MDIRTDIISYRVASLLKIYFILYADDEIRILLNLAILYIVRKATKYSKLKQG